MTDFYTLLKQSIIDRGIRDADDREAVYAQARQAIVKQLWAFRPPLAADEIDTRVGAYDEAVERIERDVRAAFAEAKSPSRERTRSLPEREPPIEEARLLEPVEEADAPPLDTWRHAEEEEEDVSQAPYAEEDDDYGHSVPRATSMNGARRVDFNDADFPDGDAPATRRGGSDRHEEEPASPVDAYDDGNAVATHHERWSNDGIETVQRRWLPSLNERETIQILAGAISALVIALIALAAFFYFSRGGEGDGDAVTLDIGVRREVSDAATAARIPNEPLEVAQSYSLFDGRDPTIFATTPDNPIRYVSDGGYARVSSSASSPGVRAIIGPGLADRLAGKRVRVTLVVRSSTDFGAASMRFAYQSGVAISHWQTANPSSDYSAVGMIWRVPAMRTDPAGDHLVIEPGIPGDGTGVDIQSITIDVLAGDG